MTPEEKKLLITTHLGEQLKRVMHIDHMPPNYYVQCAEIIMNEREDEVRGNQLEHHRGLWDIIAPLTDGIAIYRAVDKLLAAHAGEPLTNEVREGMMLELGRIIATHSRTTEVLRATGMRSSSSGTTRVWGGPLPGTKDWVRMTQDDEELGSNDYRDGAGV